MEGRIKGTVSLQKNTLTIGAQGRIDAEVFAHTILVDGTVNGDLFASEFISIRKSARIDGNVLAPRISLEDGAKFRGSIDMDTDSEAFKKAFSFRAETAAPGKSSKDQGEVKSGNNPGAKPAQHQNTGSGQQPKNPQQQNAKLGGTAA
ncbi:MAG: polymer-forming cytoskeletal protein [Wenzhouxiangellaceae bacterium]|nr:polymer-forming cytoskeletal protein [Wenzhouxiangellaceae bacterium]